MDLDNPIVSDARFVWLENQRWFATIIALSHRVQWLPELIVYGTVAAFMLV